MFSTFKIVCNKQHWYVILLYIQCRQQNKSMKSHRPEHRHKTEEEDSRVELHALLSTMKNRKTERTKPTSHSVEISNHYKYPQNEVYRKISLPEIKRKKVSLQHGKLNSFQKHIVGNYLNAHLRNQKQNSPVGQLKSKKKDLKIKFHHKNKIKKKETERTIEEAGETMNQAGLDSVRKYSKIRNQYRSKYAQGFDSKKGLKTAKEFSLKDEPMKNYIHEKGQRMKKQWKQTSPLELETYFSMLKQKSHISPHKSGDKNKDPSSKKQISLPKQEDVSKYIKSYIPRNNDIKMVQFIKRKHFTIDFGKDHLFFGQVSEGRREGIGIFIKQNYLFQGHWKKGKKLKGIQINQKGVYSGNFKQDRKEGKGSFTWINGQFYEGEWSAGRRHGVGMWSSPKGDTYMGQWRKGVVQGQGVHKTSKGQRYEGTFKGFLKHGWGKEKFPNGDLFQGNYREGLPHGSGKYFWKDGTIYEGQFCQGLRTGKGSIKNQRGFHFQGNFLKEKSDGICSITYENGETYEGEMKNGKRDGKGTLKNDEKRQVFSGYWKQDQFIPEDEYC